MVNRIYFIISEKSFDITEVKNGAEVWYDWVERKKNFMRKMTLNRNVMLWVCSFLHTTSDRKGNELRRWKSRDHVYNFFCTKKYNDFGRYISIEAVQGECRAVIILPEVAFNVGWRDVALNIEKFINKVAPAVKSFVKPTVKSFIKPTEEHSYMEAFKTDKWEAKGTSTSSAQTPFGQRVTVQGPEISDKDLLSRCLVGSFSDMKELPTLSDIRRWATNKWSNIPGIQMYEMHGSKFLFEFLSRKMADHIKMGEWRWRNKLLMLEWWSPTVGCYPADAKLDWV